MGKQYMSGRRKSYPNLEMQIAKLADSSVTAIKEIRDDVNNPASVRLEAAKYLIDRHAGKPRQAMDMTADINTTPISAIEHHLDLGDNHKESADAIQRQSEHSTGDAPVSVATERDNGD